ncbi:hypothetical protein AAVH_07717 [Aphelenchoides avenae]|nr:hypothetical protein AAVH_07717 [Aphelenchus avenae]
MQVEEEDRKNADPVDRLESSIAMLKQYLAKDVTQLVEASTGEGSRDTELQKDNDDLKKQLSALRKLYDEEKLLVGEQSEELAKFRVAAKEAKKLEKKSKKN